MGSLTRRQFLLVAGWKELAVEADVYLWLDRQGVKPSLARKLIRLYGNDTVTMLEENPYRLLAFTFSERVSSLPISKG